jgi:hypothetical protein
MQRLKNSVSKFQGADAIRPAGESLDAIAAHVGLTLSGALVLAILIATF